MMFTVACFALNKTCLALIIPLQWHSKEWHYLMVNREKVVTVDIFDVTFFFKRIKVDKNQQQLRLCPFLVTSRHAAKQYRMVVLSQSKWSH